MYCICLSNGFAIDLLVTRQVILHFITNHHRLSSVHINLTAQTQRFCSLHLHSCQQSRFFLDCPGNEDLNCPGVQESWQSVQDYHMQVRKLTIIDYTTFTRVTFILEVVIHSFPINVSLVFLILNIIKFYNTATETFTWLFFL